MEQTNGIINFSEAETAAIISENIEETDSEGFVTSQHTSVLFSDSNIPNESPEDIVHSKPPISPIPYISKEPVLFFQLIICLIIAAAAFIVKSVGGEMYVNVKDCYSQHLNNSIIIDLNNSYNRDFVNNIIDNEQKSH